MDAHTRSGVRSCGKSSLSNYSMLGLIVTIGIYVKQCDSCCAAVPIIVSVDYHYNELWYTEVLHIKILFQYTGHQQVSKIDSEDIVSLDILVFVSKANTTIIVRVCRIKESELCVSRLVNRKQTSTIGVFK